MLSLLNPLPIPILVTQHCGAFFTDALLDMINVYSKMPAILAREGEKLEEGVVYLAPGNHHMGVVSVDGEPQIHLMFTPPENLSRPAIDPMLNSLPEVFSKDILGIILTGMGNDGLLGSKKIIESGGAIFAQDQKTSTVWDMPSKVIRAQFCSFVGSIPELCSKIEEVIVK
jgi:two-component system chemotaxis response regulator CheB